MFNRCYREELLELLKVAAGSILITGTLMMLLLI